MNTEIDRVFRDQHRLVRIQGAGEIGHGQLAGSQKRHLKTFSRALGLKLKKF